MNRPGTRADTELLRVISTNCRRNRALPNREHGCTGCDCTCHHTAAPRDFRALVAEFKEANADEHR